MALVLAGTLLLGADLPATLAGVGLFGALVSVFAGAFALLSKGTDRIDNAAADRVKAAEEERDRALEAEKRTREQCERDKERHRAAWQVEKAQLEAEVVEWRERYLACLQGRPSPLGPKPPADPPKPPADPGEDHIR